MIETPGFNFKSYDNPVIGKVEVLTDIDILGYKQGDIIDYYGFDPCCDRVKCAIVLPSENNEWRKLFIKMGYSGYAVLYPKDYSIIYKKGEREHGKEVHYP